MTFAELGGFASDVTIQAMSMYLGGVSLQGGMCGALTGALAVIGASQSSVNPADKISRNKAVELGKACMEWFKNEINETECIKLTGVNL